MNCRDAMIKATSGDSIKCICDAKNPADHIEISSELRNGEKGPYKITVFDAYKDGEKQKCEEFPHGEFRRCHTCDGNNTSEAGESHWENIINEVQRKCDFGDVMVFGSVEEYQKFIKDPKKNTPSEPEVNDAQGEPIIPVAPEQVYNTNKQDELSDSNIIPVIRNRMAGHLDKIAVLEVKRDNQQAKINEYFNKIEKHSARVERLKMINTVLSQYVDRFPVLSGLIQKNNDKIDKINKEKIPALEEKIALRSAKISNINHKISIRQCRVSRLAHLDNMIKSFHKPDGRAEFEKSLYEMRKCSRNILEYKLSKCDKEIEKLADKYEKSDNASEKLEIAAKIQKLRGKQAHLNRSLEKLNNNNMKTGKDFTELINAKLEQTSEKINTDISIDVEKLSEEISCAEPCKLKISASVAEKLNSDVAYVLEEKDGNLVITVDRDDKNHLIAPKETQKELYYLAVTDDQKEKLNAAGIKFESKDKCDVIAIAKSDKEKANGVIKSKVKTI